MTPPRACAVQAPAKVNLLLAVGRLRDDGFHDIETLFQAVTLADAVRVTLHAGDVSLAVEGPDSVEGPDLGPAEHNLAVRAARLFLAEVDAGEGARIQLTKRIPAGAGLGGGSSDGAAVLRALNHLWNGAVPGERLFEMGAALGSDVPFFLGASPLARGTGRGERIEALPPLPPAHLVLVLPPVHVSTAEAYRALARGPERPVRSGPADAGPAGAGSIAVPTTWDEVQARAHNDFQAPVAAGHPEVRRSLQSLRDAGAGWALLSGSGAACFGHFGGEAEARAAAAAIAGEVGWQASSVRTLSAFPDPEAHVPGA